MPRDNFSAKTIEILAKRVRYKCSNPNCCRITVGPQEGRADAAMNIGIAAHITAASPGGPRYCASMTTDERSSIDNGIWLCSNCSAMIDKDEKKYTVDLLHEWKRQAEKNTSDEITGIISSLKQESTSIKIFVKEWTKMPDILESFDLNTGMDIMFIETGGIVKSGDRWINYINRFEEWQKPYIEAIRLDIINRNIKITGVEHQNNSDGTPKFNNGKYGLFTFRAWGDLMAATWAEYENSNYSYLDFYM